jgi:SAM-dependent methyltransferase
MTVFKTPPLVSERELERSDVVANCTMNRERQLRGSNGYDHELGFDPLVFLRERLPRCGRVAWLDLCCGSARALREASDEVEALGLADRIEIWGVDLVGPFTATSSATLRLIEANLANWKPDRHFDLVTCVHGLHYLGDKLGLLERSWSWLEPDGLFAAHLDFTNLRFADGKPAGRRLLADLRKAGVLYHRQKHLLTRRGQLALTLGYRHLGSDDRAGPNFTRQPAVDSYYARHIKLPKSHVS